MTDLAEQVMVAIGERDQAVIDAEARAGEALREWTEVEGQTLAEMVEWCDGLLTPREATRLRRLADDADGGNGTDGDDKGEASEHVGDRAGDRAGDQTGAGGRRVM